MDGPAPGSGRSRPRLTAPKRRTNVQYRRAPLAALIEYILMTFGLALTLLNLALLTAMMLLFAVGRRLGARDLKKDPKGMRSGLGAVEAAVLALLGLLLAFTIAGAGGRFDIRRNQIVEEANAIGTAYLRLDVLPAAMQPGLREAFRSYVDTRLAVYRN